MNQYSPGRIPGEVVQPILQAWIDNQPTEVATGRGGGTATSDPMLQLAIRAGYERDTVYRVLKGQRKTIEFTMADRLVIAATGMPMIDFFEDYPELEEAYYSVELVDAPVRPEPVVKTCERKGCQSEVLVTGKAPQSGVTAKRFCSEECREAAARKRNGQRVTETPGWPWQYECKNGHERTPENTIIRKNGDKQCLTCRREGDRRRRAA